MHPKAFITIFQQAQNITWQSSCVIANNAQKIAKAICPRL